MRSRTANMVRVVAFAFRMGKGLGTIVAPSGGEHLSNKFPIFPQVTGGDHALFASGDWERTERVSVYLAVYGCVRKPDSDDFD